MSFAAPIPLSVLLLRVPLVTLRWFLSDIALEARIVEFFRFDDPLLLDRRNELALETKR